MTKYISYIFIFFSFIASGQKKFSTNELLNSFPFDKTTKVKMVSYNMDFVSESPIPLPPVGKDRDSTLIKKIIANRTFPIKLENILGNENIEGIKQSKTLTFKETYRLLQLLYNTCGKFPNNHREISMCFFPRNAILFYDEKGKVFEILEICFECHRIRFSSKESLEINEICNDFYFKLEKLFNDSGLETQHNRKY